MKEGDVLTCISWDGITFTAGKRYKIVKLNLDGSINLRPLPLEFAAEKWLPARLFQHFHNETSHSISDDGAMEYEDIMKVQELLGEG